MTNPISKHKVACIGSGTVGRSWAVVLASAGHEVALWDQAPEAMAQAGDLIAAILRDLEEAGAIDGAANVAGRIRFVPDLRDALADAVYVQENIVERVDIKRALFQQLDALAPPAAIIGSSTSSIPGSLFMTGLKGSARCLVAHPVNPPHLIRLVELCPSPETAPETVERAATLLRAAGQTPIRLDREIPGFLLNRLQWALFSEAMHLVGEGYCSAEDIDAVMTDGLAPRWALLGPLSVAHLNAAGGFAGYCSGLAEAITRVRESLRTDYVPDEPTIAAIHASLERQMPLSALARHQAERDRDILALRSFLDRRPK